MTTYIKTLARMQEGSQQEHKVNNRQDEENISQMSQPCDHETKWTTTTITSTTTLSPFSNFIMLIPLPDSFKHLVTLKRYDSTGEP